MPEHGQEPQGAGFAAAREFFAETVQWLSGPEAACLTHAELEEQLDTQGRELLRRLHQDHLDLRAAREQRREKVTGADGITRTRVETGHQRRLATVFGDVTVTRITYRAPGAANLHPADAELNLPEEKHSHGLRKLAVIEAARLLRVRRPGNHQGHRDGGRQAPGRAACPPRRRGYRRLLHDAPAVPSAP
jgi:hypothetical protein